jgi:hypothetical protein
LVAAQEVPATSGDYSVMVDSNHAFMDTEARYCAGKFDTAEAAVRKAKDIIIESLADLWQPGSTGGDLYSSWLHFGDSPFVVGPGGAPPVEYSASSFARAMAEYMATLG